MNEITLSTGERPLPPQRKFWWQKTSLLFYLIFIVLFLVSHISYEAAGFCAILGLLFGIVSMAAILSPRYRSRSFYGIMAAVVLMRESAVTLKRLDPEPIKKVEHSGPAQAHSSKTPTVNHIHRPKTHN